MRCFTSSKWKVNAIFVSASGSHLCVRTTGGALDTQIAGPAPDLPTLLVWNRARECVSLTSFQALWLLLVQRTRVGDPTLKTTRYQLEKPEGNLT